MARSLLKAIQAVKEPQQPHKQFLGDLMLAIEKHSQQNQRKGSNWYKPSSLNCLRQMYFMRTSAEQDKQATEYNAIGMADTGTRRHVAIQDVLEQMDNMGFDWVYLDVEEYLKYKQSKGECLNIIVQGKFGAETKLFDKTLQTSFMCDGILYNKITDDYYLFEFKNQISFKFSKKEKTKAIDEEHHNQVICYCTSLDLNKALVTYENRDTLMLEVPELFIVTDEMKTELSNHIFTCEEYVKDLKVPLKPIDINCRWCSYKGICRKSGN